SVARCAQHLLGVVGCSTSLSRAVGHAAVAVAFDGLALSRPVAEAAARLLSQFDSGPDDDTASETTPHRLRMVTVVRALASQQNGELDSIHKLVATAYGLEALRLKIRPGHVAPRIEVLAVGMEQLDTAWMKLIINVEGLLPPGSRVQLPDGRAALVLGAGDPINPWRPLVLCEGRVLVPDSAVRIP
nr:hypothetical protein [Deltaproteobacteria bacterium]